MGRKYIVTRPIMSGATGTIEGAMAELKDILVLLNKGVETLNQTMSEGIQQSREASVLAEKLIVKLGEKDESKGP